MLLLIHWSYSRPNYRIDTGSDAPKVSVRGSGLRGAN